MAWNVESTEEFEAWYLSLSDRDRVLVVAAVSELEVHGPALGRPFADIIQSSRHSNMKELRTRGQHIRVLFAFDPRRTAILLIGGNKQGKWNRWYREMVPIADNLYDEYLRGLKEKGIIT